VKKKDLERGVSLNRFPRLENLEGGSCTVDFDR